MPNILTEVTPKLLAQGLMALREQAVFPMLVNRGYEVEAGRKGSQVDVPIPSAVPAQPVVPSNVPPVTPDVAPTSVPIVLDRWFESPFYMTDKDLMTAQEGTIPMQASEAIKSIANNVDSYIVGLYNQVGGYVGTVGQVPYQNVATPSADHEGTLASTRIRKVLNKQLAPADPRYIVLSSDAEANALELPAFSFVSYSGTDAQATGNLGARLGFEHYFDQNLDDTTQSGSGAGTITVSGAGQTGSTLTTAGSTTDPDVGELFSIAGDTQTYSVTAVNGNDWTVRPSIKTAPADGASITLVGAHTLHGLAFHRNAFALAMRPPLLDEASDSPGIISMTMSDPVSQLALRLRISTEHYQTRYAYSVLYGAECIRPELAGRIIG